MLDARELLGAALLLPAERWEGEGCPSVTSSPGRGLSLEKTALLSPQSLAGHAAGTNTPLERTGHRQ